MARYPAYAVVYERLKMEILEGDFKIGDLIPPEPELEKRFQVSRTTIRKAIELLTQEGLVSVKQGRGTMVLDYRTKQNLSRVTSISETLSHKGIEVSSKKVYVDIIEATPSMAQKLSMSEGGKVVRVQRVQWANDKPLVIMKNYLPYALVSGIEEYTTQLTFLYRFLEEQYSITIERTEDCISAKNADFYEAEMLQVPIGTALMTVKRTCYDDKGPVCLDHTYVIGEKYELEISTQGRLK